MPKGRWLRWTWLIVAASMAAVLLIGGSLAGAQDALPVAGTIYYQVTYSDGTVEQRNTPPPTNAGIRSVSRVARYEPELPSYETASTGNAPVENLNPGRTVVTEMTWDGSKWAPQITDSPIKAAQRRKHGQPSRPTDAETAAQARRAQHLAAAIDAVNRLGQSLEQANELLEQDASESATKARLELLQARQLHIQAMTALIAVQSHDRGQAGPLPTGITPAGRIVTGRELGGDARKGLPLSDAIGVARPIAKAGPLNHRVQIWKVPDDQAGGTRNVRVAMAHPQGGEAGAFRYVAYADTDADGKPDKLLGVSPVAQADAPGGWSGWAFQTDATDLYVGNAWQDAATPVYGEVPTEQQLRNDWRTLDSDVWFSGALTAEFSGGTYTPWISNIRVHTQRPNSDYDVGPRVILREEE
jgi:hypothetical protein